jgi:PAS domain S-box-containing protein
MKGLELGLLDQVPLAVAITTSDGTIGYWNRGAETLYGWPRHDVVRRQLESLAATGRGSVAVREALEAVASGGLWSGRVSLSHRTGEVVTVDARFSPLQNSVDETIGVIVVAVEAASSSSSTESAATARIGRRIARARKEAGLTQQELADRIGVTRRSVQGYESGAIAPYRHLDQLAAAVGQTHEWLVAEEPGNGTHPSLSLELKSELRDLIREELGEALREWQLGGRRQRGRSLLERATAGSVG